MADALQKFCHHLQDFRDAPQEKAAASQQMANASVSEAKRLDPEWKWVVWDAGEALASATVSPPFGRLSWREV